ncbi:mRNA splicing protein SYF1 PWA37_001458 [Arxiozyma heterogenica]|uniref:mRNA splicing protein SYF1 n=1 Tax=Arxiozyma heterogenica TaxID=278026 RepID=UPI002EF50F0F
MENIIDKYIINDEDVAFEYELQKDSSEQVSWARYLDSWKKQYSVDPTRRTIDHLIWLYNRYVNHFRNNLDPWSEYITWMIQINTVENRKYTDFILDLHEECLKHVKVKDSGKISIQYLKLAVESCNLSHIRKAFDISLQRNSHSNGNNNNSKVKHAEIWETLIVFLQEKLIPVCSMLREGDNNDDDYILNNEDNDDSEKSQLEKLEISIYKALVESKNTKKLNNSKENYKESEVINSINIWASQFLERYLIVCPNDRINDILLLLSKTFDHQRIKFCFDKCLFKNPKLTTFEVPLSLYLIYLNCLDQLSLLDEYQKLLAELKDKYPKEQARLIIFDINHSIKRKDVDTLSIQMVQELSKMETLKNFVTLYDYSIDFEQACINTILQEMKGTCNSDDWNSKLNTHVVQLSNLLDSRDIMINDLKLRQNINNIDYWRERVYIMNSLEDRAKVYSEALAKISPLKVNQPGNLGKFWCEYLKIYWDTEDYDTAREIYEAGTRVPFPFLDDLEIVYLDWVNNELNTFGSERALNILIHILEIPESFESYITKFNEGHKTVPAQSVLFNSLKLWQYYLDLLESRPLTEGNVKDTVNAYESVVKLRLITPLMFVNYANFVNVSANAPLESYKIYQRCLNLFSQSIIIQYEIWMKYLSDVIRDIPVSGMKKESIRDLFDNCISELKNQHEIDTISIYLKYNTFEEEIINKNVPTRQGINILLDGARSIADNFMDSKVKLWQLALDKTNLLLGAEACRPIYEECVEKITPDSRCVEYIIKFAKLEMDLREFKRVREILRYGARLLAPALNTNLWNFWDQFEVQYGDKDQYKEMLTLKKELEDSMKVDSEAISEENSHIQFVSAKRSNNHNDRSSEKESNPNEIDLDI